MDIKRERAAWAAGLFDGEGSVTIQRQRGRAYPHIAMGQVDREVLDRFRDAVGEGAVYGPYQQGEHRPIHQYMVTGQPAVERVFDVLRFWLGTVKTAQFQRCIDGAAAEMLARPPRRCKSGNHVLSEVDRVNGGCGPCYRERHPRSKH